MKTLALALALAFTAACGHQSQPSQPMPGEPIAPSATPASVSTSSISATPDAGLPMPTNDAPLPPM
ncbi:MAG TPA: hypothetical protein VH143_13610 [Kofleriaceae bacterium]|nr:hypothetical protein [Kofleriaceae bacterium]